MSASPSVRERGFGCGTSGGVLAVSGYGWKAKPSRTGSVLPLARSASPSSRMKVPGECVGRAPFGRSLPRGPSAPPQTRTSGSASSTAS